MSIEQRMRNLSFNLYKNGNIAGALALLGEALELGTKQEQTA